MEPCVGGGSVIRLMDNPRIGADICPYLVAFYKQLQDGWLPPEHISEQRYQELKQLYKNGACNGEIGFAAYFCSFAGKFWGGYARDKKTNRDFSHEAYIDSIKLSHGQYKDSIRLQSAIQGIDFRCLTYKETLDSLPISKFSRCLVYIDPPYEGTTEYRNKFNHDEFWEVVKNYSVLHDIYVSSYVAREGFECIWSIARKTELNIKTGTKANRIEKLFKYKGEKA